MPPPVPVAPRGPTTQTLLQLKWDYPVYASTQERQRSDATAPVAARAALKRDDALHFIAGHDPRPLLVLRECSHCNKTDNALLTPGWDNEKVLFLARWYHCVKLPVDVVQHDHPFNTLFPSDSAEHLFVTTLDGSVKIPLEASTSRSELCQAMSQVLAASYAKDPTLLFKDLHTLSDHFDVLDERVRALQAKKAELMESRISGDKQKVAKLDAEIATVRKEIDQKLAAFDRSSKIALRDASASAKPAEKPKSEG
jgi:hypothetical protein